MLLAFVLFGLAAGAMLPFQEGINSQLAGIWTARFGLRSSRSWWAGVLVLVWLLFARGWSSAERMSAARWWVWIGGALGAFYSPARSWRRRGSGP